MLAVTITFEKLTKGEIFCAGIKAESLNMIWINCYSYKLSYKNSLKVDWQAGYGDMSYNIEINMNCYDNKQVKNQDCVKKLIIRMTQCMWISLSDPWIKL